MVEISAYSPGSVEDILRVVDPTICMDSLAERISNIKSVTTKNPKRFN